jgi:hypothetical protein
MRQSFRLAEAEIVSPTSVQNKLSKNINNKQRVTYFFAIISIPLRVLEQRLHQEKHKMRASASTKARSKNEG